MAGHGLHAHPTPGVSIDYFAAGAGRPLVHGITESRRTWDPLVAPLIAAGYRVITLDLRGHGASSKVAPYDLATMAGAITAPYLSLHGIDPVNDYEGWLTSRIPSATVEVWSGLGHSPHLIESDRFIARIAEFDGG